MDIDVPEKNPTDRGRPVSPPASPPTAGQWDQRSDHGHVTPTSLQEQGLQEQIFQEQARNEETRENMGQNTGEEASSHSHSRLLAQTALSALHVPGFQSVLPSFSSLPGGQEVEPMFSPRIAITSMINP